MEIYEHNKKLIVHGLDALAMRIGNSVFELRQETEYPTAYPLCAMCDLDKICTTTTSGTRIFAEICKIFTKPGTAARWVRYNEGDST